MSGRARRGPPCLDVVPHGQRTGAPTSCSPPAPRERCVQSFDPVDSCAQPYQPTVTNTSEIVTTNSGLLISARSDYALCVSEPAATLDSAKIRMLMAAKGLKVRSLARSLGCHPNTVQRWRKANPSAGLALASKLARALGVAVGDLVVRDAPVDRGSLDIFLSSPIGQGATQGERERLERMWTWLGDGADARPTAESWQHLLSALRSMTPR